MEVRLEKDCGFDLKRLLVYHQLVTVKKSVTRQIDR
jgi:hypothetical protein